VVGLAVASVPGVRNSQYAAKTWADSAFDPQGLARSSEDDGGWLHGSHII
jgi:hypothetical protein